MLGEVVFKGQGLEESNDWVYPISTDEAQPTPRWPTRQVDGFTKIKDGDKIGQKIGLEEEASGGGGVCMCPWETEQVSHGLSLV